MELPYKLNPFKNRKELRESVQLFIVKKNRIRELS